MDATLDSPVGSRVMVCGKVVEGVPHNSDEYRATAQHLGYGDDTLSMCRDHDPLHVAICKWLGIGTSYSLREAVGISLDELGSAIAAAEEDAVMAVQRFAKLAGVELSMVRR